MKVFFSLAILLVCMQAALGFMPTAPLRTRQAIKMSATNNKVTEVVKAGKSALAGLTPLILASPVFATEGTGEVRVFISLPSGKMGGIGRRLFLYIQYAFPAQAATIAHNPPSTSPPLYK